MAGSYDGSIRIDTSINAVPIDKGIAQIENKIKGLAATIGLAFGVKELIDFGKRSIDAASDLAEAQNVVDTAFGDMSYKMEQFAATALETYGISELTAKNMGSTYMAMAKGMGVATDAASDMAVTLTGRLSDIMSFYNKTQSEVDTIGRALITGETEPLKAIGVVMTQTNLSAYAMAQGFSKTYAEMSSNEQLLVRYKYFLEQTSLAQGDFAKTSEGWANQTRLLSERINEFMTNLGGVIMNVLTPALQFANEAVTFLNDLFFDGKSEEETTAAKNAEAVTDEVTQVGAAADKSKKKLNNLLSGFDELHVISGAGSDKDKENTTDAGIDTSNLLGVNLDADTLTAKKAAQKYRDIINEIYLAFKRHPLTKTIEGIIGAIGKFFGFIKGNKDISAGDIVDTLMDILGAILAYKALSGIVGGVKAFAGGFSSLISLITAHPVVAAIAGITALTIGIIALSEEMEHQRIASYFGDISISLEEIDQIVGPITEDVDNVAQAFEDNKDKLTTAKDNFSDIAQAVQEVFDSFEKNNAEQDVEGFAKQLDELVDGALEVNNATFDTSAWKAAFLADDGVIDEFEQKTLDDFEQMGDSIADKIRGYGVAIHSITDKAIKESRDLTQAEIDNLKTLYQELAEMTQAQTQAESEATWERLKRGAYSYDSYEELASRIKEAQEHEEKAKEELRRSMYTDALAKLNSELAAGEIDETEFERQKEELLQLADDKVKALDINSKRNEREAVLAWTQGAFTNIAKSFAFDDTELEKMQQYFKLILTNPDGMDAESVGKLLPQMDQRDVELFYSTYGALDEMKKQLGFDFFEKWTELNDTIGDTMYTTEDFFDALTNLIDNVTPLSVNDILPTLEKFKEYPDKYTEILREWADKQHYTIELKGEIDEEAFNDYWDEFISDTKKEQLALPSSFIGQSLTDKFNIQNEKQATSEWAAQQPYNIKILGKFDEEGFEKYWEKYISDNKPSLQFRPSLNFIGPQQQSVTDKFNIQLNVDIDNSNQTVKADNGVTAKATWKNDSMMDNGGGR